MATSANPPLPDYDSPPVIEVVCGFQFAPLDRFLATSFGLLWERFRAEYPICEQHPPLVQVTERLGQPIAEESQVEFSSEFPLPRIFFVHRSPCWLIQVQNDRFLHNWRKQDEADAYPRFPEVFGKFWAAWEQFLRFCDDEKLGTPRLNQLEVTYINHVVQGEGWDGMDTIGGVFPDIGWRTPRSFLPTLESVNWTASFALPETTGRLHASVRHAVRRRDSRAVLLCELTARGLPRRLDHDSVRNWFQLGREWIVRGFADLTGERIQTEIWKRRSV
ncbi:MAG: hypothetical protein CHACPFDD_00604 [Phycisphaerae bacterium]|nr:hypothetical protein [Phycisphaerae bacterium]